jgi:hypothetical protein
MTDHDFAQRTLLALLLAEHPSMLTVEDIERRLGDVPRLREALDVLVRDGLASRLGDLIGVSRAAVRARQLTP